MMGAIPLFKMKIWYHICSSLDTVNGAFAIAVNGEMIGNGLDAVADLMDNHPIFLKNILIIGGWIRTWDHSANQPQQFCGAVSNL